jgi:hypothetical protein
MKNTFHGTMGFIAALTLLSASVSAVAREPDEMTATTLTAAHPMSARGPVKAVGSAQLAAAIRNSTAGNAVPGIDSLVNFTGSYYAKGFDNQGHWNTNWTYAMIGRGPGGNRSARLRAPVIPVSVDLRDKHGHPRTVGGHALVSDAAAFVRPVVNSPIFQNYGYSSSSMATQYTDAVQRAEFWSRENDSWHTLMWPKVGTPQVMKLSQDPACGTTNPNGSAGHCNYTFKLNADGTCCLYILVDINVFSAALFPATAPVDNSTPVGAAELNGDVTTADISSFLFPNTFLYFGDTSQCCVLGYHSFDFEPGDAANGNLPRFYVLNYSAWITPGLFGAAFEDITGLSHELSESFNDPFVVFDNVTNLTPWWLSPNGNCQNDLEVGDVVEGLPNATFPIKMHGYTYHPQNEALLQWFEFQSPSDAISGAYSYPDQSVITALSARQKLNCKS